MPDLLFAYLFAGAVILGLAAFARHNQAQGWKRQRTSWHEMRAEAAERAFLTPQPIPVSNNVLQHLGELRSLSQALSSFGESNRPEATPAASQEDLVRTR